VVDELPPPGTLEDLLADATANGWRTNERMLREWKRLGLLGVPVQRSLGRGHGQLPGLYASKQRALFGVLARLRGQGARNEQLAKVVVFAWAYSDDEWVDTAQAAAALRTGLSNPRKSLRVATRAAKLLVNQIDLARAAPVHRHALIDELSRGLYQGKVDQVRLREKVSAVVDGGGVSWP
jgi:hypothetical protein